MQTFKQPRLWWAWISWFFTDSITNLRGIFRKNCVQPLSHGIFFILFEAKENSRRILWIELDPWFWNTVIDNEFFPRILFSKPQIPIWQNYITILLHIFLHYFYLWSEAFVVQSPIYNIFQYFINSNWSNSDFSFTSTAHINALKIYLCLLLFWPWYRSPNPRASIDTHYQ